MISEKLYFIFMVWRNYSHWIEFGKFSLQFYGEYFWLNATFFSIMNIYINMIFLIDWHWIWFENYFKDIKSRKSSSILMKIRKMLIIGKKRQTVWTSVLWRMILSTNRHLRVGSMLKNRFFHTKLRILQNFSKQVQ